MFEDFSFSIHIQAYIQVMLNHKFTMFIYLIDEDNYLATKVLKSFHFICSSSTNICIRLANLIIP